MSKNFVTGFFKAFERGLPRVSETLEHKEVFCGAPDGFEERDKMERFRVQCGGVCACVCACPHLDASEVRACVSLCVSVCMCMSLCLRVCVCMGREWGGCILWLSCGVCEGVGDPWPFQRKSSLP